ncbi:MAG TPA: hypothetical protein VJ691_11435, partial [Vicinamibacterales bacterium]|nr:hypothetical protein [Vicinamibacterales bacterium]
IWSATRKVMMFVFVGALVGVPLALSAGAAIRSLLFGISPAQTEALVLAFAATIVVTLLACLLPARRISSANITRTLNAE